MASQRHTDADREAVRAFIHALYEQSGQPSWAAFAREARVGEFGLADWRNGRGMPDAVNFLRLLDAAGPLRAEPVALTATANPLAPPAPDDSQEALLVEAAELVREVRLLLPGLRAYVEARSATAESHLPEKAAN